MEGTEIDLIQMLDCRERRGFIQNELLGKYHCPVISFCMNIPGPIKTNPQIREAFLTGLAALTTALEEASITVLQSYDIAELTGDEWIAAVDADSAKVKELTMEIENRHPFGRLFDIDVIGVDGVKLSRPRYRKCLICGKQAQECARGMCPHAGALCPSDAGGRHEDAGEVTAPASPALFLPFTH